MFLSFGKNFKVVSLLFLFISSAPIQAMQATRLTSLESPRARQQKRLPSVEEIKKMNFKRTSVSGISAATMTIGCLAFLYCMTIYTCASEKCTKSLGLLRKDEDHKRYDNAIDEPFVRGVLSMLTGASLAICAEIYRSILDSQYENRVFVPLKEAIKHENVQDVQQLIAADVNMQNYGLTPLRISLREKKQAITQMLLERGADPERGDHSALFDCVDHADRWTLELLLKNKANPNAVCNKSNCCGQTILNYVISGQHAHSHKAGCVQLLIQHGADPRQKNPKDKRDSYQMNTSIEIAELLEANKG